jgi:lambda family phage portal protein
VGLRSAIRELFRPERSRRVRQYQGARINRLTSDWVVSGTSADGEVRSSLRLLRDRARQLTRDNDYARQALRAVENNVVGQGIGFQSQVRMQRGQGRLDPRLNRTIEEAWHRWTRADSCDVGGRLCFSDIERLCVRSVAESGEVIIRLVEERFGNSLVPLALEVIEADLLLDDYNGTTDNGNEIRMGVEVDKWGRPVAYHFAHGMRHPGDYQFQGQAYSREKTLRIPARNILHLYRVERPGQSRGVTWFASAIERMHHMSGYEQAEVVSARATSALMGFITSPEGELFGDDVEQGERVSTFEPGVFKYLNPGEQVTVPNLNRPGGEFDPFMRAMLRAVAAGLGCSYESISKDFSQTNYSSSRLSLLDERDHWRVLQSWLIENFHQKVYERWLDLAVLSGTLSLPRYEIEPEFYRQPRWMPRGWSWVDPQKEILAYKEAEKAGYVTKSQIIAEAGGDYEDVFEQRRRELDLAEELDLTFDTDSAAPEPPAPPAIGNSADGSAAEPIQGANE